MITSDSLTIANLQNDVSAMNAHAQQYVRKFTSANVTKALFDDNGRPRWKHASNLINGFGSTLAFWILHHLEKEPTDTQEKVLQFLYLFQSEKILTRMIYLHCPTLAEVLDSTDLKSDTPICPYYKTVTEYAQSTFTAYELDEILPALAQSKTKDENQFFLEMFQNRILTSAKDQEVFDAIQGSIENDQSPLDTLGIGSLRQNIWGIYICGMDRNNENFHAGAWSDKCIDNIVALNMDPALVIQEIHSIQQSDVFQTEIRNDGINIFLFYELMNKMLYADEKKYQYLSSFGVTYINMQLEKDPKFKILANHYAMWMHGNDLQTLQKHQNLLPLGNLINSVIKDKENDWEQYNDDTLYFLMTQGINDTHEKYLRNCNDLTPIACITMSMHLITKLVKCNYTIDDSFKSKLAIQTLINAERYLVDTSKTSAGSCLSIYDLLVNYKPDLTLPPVLQAHHKKLNLTIDPAVKEEWLATIIQWCNTVLDIPLTIESWEKMYTSAIQSEEAMRGIVDNYSRYETLIQAVLVLQEQNENRYDLNFTI